MHFLTLPTELALHLLEGEEDQVSGIADQRIQEIQRSACPRCGSRLQARLYPQQLFAEGDPSPRFIATCDCGFQVDPQSKIVLSPGSAAAVTDPLPIIDPKR